MSKHGFFALLGGMLLCLSCLEEAMAQNKIIVHPPRPTRDTFPKHPDLSYDEFLKTLEIRGGFDEMMKDPTKYAREFTPLYEVKSLPACAISQDRKEILATAPQVAMSRFEYVFYSPDVPVDKKNAEKLGRAAVAYKIGKHNINDAAYDPRARWADLLQVKCLPTRVFLSQDPQGSYAIYAEGNNAWNKEE